MLEEIKFTLRSEAEEGMRVRGAPSSGALWATPSRKPLPHQEC